MLISGYFICFLCRKVLCAFRYWVKENIDIPNASYVTRNKGKDSFGDMLSMSRCKVGIIANSSFSIWGAILGIKKTFVVKLVKWIGNEAP